MLCFHEKHLGPLLVGRLLAFLKCNVKYLLRLHQGWEEIWTCSGKCTGPGTIGALAAAVALALLLQLSKPLHTRMGRHCTWYHRHQPQTPTFFYISISIMEALHISLQRSCSLFFIAVQYSTLWIYIMFLQLTCSWICKHFHMVVDVSSGLLSENSNYWLKCKSIFSFLIIPRCVQALILFFGMLLSKNEISTLSNTIYKNKLKMDQRPNMSGNYKTLRRHYEWDIL